MRPLRCTLLLLFLLLPIVGASHCTYGVILDGAGPTQVSRYGLFERSGEIDALPSNPFDPDELALEAVFVSPSFEVLRVPGFYYQGFTRALVGGFEKLAADGDPEWRVRFTPHEEGTWWYQWRATTPDELLVSSWQQLSVGPSDDPGFVRRSSFDSRYLAHDDGSPYFAVGENVCWYGGGGTADYERWYARLAAEGANYSRLWMPSWAFSIEWIQRDADGTVLSRLGDYGNRMDRAWQLDRVFELALQHGIYQMLAIQNHGPFSLNANSQWADNPYNQANGGPLSDPAEVFTNEEAKKLFKQRIRYLVARWGYSPQLLAWEFWNEVDLVGGLFGANLAPAMRAWHAEMAAYLKSIDPYGHLITTSYSQPSPTTPTVGLDDFDFAQAHYYVRGETLRLPFGLDILLPIMLGTAREEGKPILGGEFGIDARGPAETRVSDPDAISLHDLLWIPIFEGSLGTGMSWWWDNWVDPQELYFHMGAVAGFLEGIAWDREGFESGGIAAEAPSASLLAFALRGEGTAIAWIRNAAHGQPADENSPLVPDEMPIVGATLNLTGLANGEWSVRWWDTYAGVEVATSTVIVTGEALSLPVPTFQKDIAVRLEAL